MTDTYCGLAAVLPSGAHVFTFDAIALLWLPHAAAAAKRQVFELGGKERKACVPLSLYTAAQNKAYGSSPFQWAQASELNRQRDSQSHTAFSVNSNGRFDAPPTPPSMLFTLSFLSYSILFPPLPPSPNLFPAPFSPSLLVCLHSDQESPCGCQYCSAECWLYTHTPLAQDAILLDLTGIV